MSNTEPTPQILTDCHIRDECRGADRAARPKCQRGASGIESL
jgi:hypothetical protein